LTFIYEHIQKRTDGVAKRTAIGFAETKKIVPTGPKPPLDYTQFTFGYTRQTLSNL